MQSGSGFLFGRIGKVLGGFWRVILAIRSIITTLAFFAIVAVIVALVSGDAPPKVPAQAALVISPAGLLVEQTTEVDGFTQMILGGNGRSEVLVSDVVSAIDRAASDERITDLVLKLDQLSIPTSYASKTYQIAAAVDRFKASGKSVIALGNYYTQANYLIASHADEIWMHPLGGVIFEGYEKGGTYFKELLDNLKVTMHIFKVGEFKSAIEPLTRNNMSEADKLASLELLSDLWAEYTAHVEGQRGFEPGTVQRLADEVAANVRAAGGDKALAAQDAGVVDELMASQQWRAALVERVGLDERTNSFHQIDMYGYLHAVGQDDKGDKGTDVAVIVAKGSIVDGEAPRGTIGGDTVARLINQARHDERTRAIVLRVDSGGGSLFASEVIRSELVAAQEAGLPVVASMGSVAASGGYWISTSADEIWAERTTITGSLGVFASFPTFENAAQWAGVTGDGVGTTRLAGASDPFRPINPDLADILQMGVENAYDHFMTLVATSRGLPEEHVRAIAEGRVWSGTAAIENGLVDKLGGLDEAIASAGAMAGLEDWNVRFIEKDISPFNQFFAELKDNAQVSLGFERQSAPRSASLAFLQRLAADAAPLLALNDPNHIYAICELCQLP